ncbi:HER182Cp [Eremothecium sinecaudum]|uniref:HER182Cp n=1 Tax=Eremothecium sinecaudum TaxID=45286 RepID=A0A0X8HTD2_9SACH|nr:HER182Cp [Eremothecium sinecaudum]AMD21461.1 HER182Cp [Eremothecium sinecaudum]
MFVGRVLPAFSRAATRGYQIVSRTRKVIPVYPPAEVKPSANVLQRLGEANLKVLDPSGAKRKLLAKSGELHLKAGCIVRVVYDSSKCNYNNILGYVLSVTRRQLIQDASILLRNFHFRTAVETRVPIFSPLVERIDIIRMPDGKRRRNKHYYIRNTKLDVGDLEASMRKR